MEGLLGMLPSGAVAPVAWLIAKILAGFFIFWGAFDFYIATFKFRKRPGVDKTAYLVNWLFKKWQDGGDPDIATKYPYVSRDLGETVGWKKDDGEIT